MCYLFLAGLRCSFQHCQLLPSDVHDSSCLQSQGNAVASVHVMHIVVCVWPLVWFAFDQGECVINIVHQSILKTLASILSTEVLRAPQL